MANLLLLVAMNDEAKPTIEKFNLQKAEPMEGLPFEIYKGEGNGQRITLMTSGRDPELGLDNVGTQAASVMAAFGIREFKPDMVLNFGTAGGFKASGAEIGTVYLCGDFKYHDRRIPIPGFDKYGVGNYASGVPKGLAAKFPVATVTTGNSLDSTENERKEMFEQAEHRPLVKEMEAAAIAQVCSWSKKPFLALKSITDIIDGEGVPQQEFMENLHLASEKLQEGVDAFLHEFTQLEHTAEFRKQMSLSQEFNEGEKISEIATEAKEHIPKIPFR